MAGTNDGLLNDVRSQPVGAFLLLCFSPLILFYNYSCSCPYIGTVTNYIFYCVVALAGKEHVLEAIESALKNGVRVEEGAVGAGAGTQVTLHVSSIY